MNGIRRLFSEYAGLAKILSSKDYLLLLIATAAHAPSVVQTKKLTRVDAAMSRQLTVKFGSSRITFPLHRIDRILKVRQDNPTFGNVREIYGRNCYLSHLRPRKPQRAVLDLGANRGMFSILAFAELEADVVVGVEPLPIYLETYRLLLEANGFAGRLAPRYLKFISNSTEESQNPARNISIPRILKEQGLERFDLVKMDIEGAEKTLFDEPEWLSRIDNLTMELHPQLVGDLSHIPAALQHYGFKYLLLDQENRDIEINSAMFLAASCVGAI